MPHLEPVEELRSAGKLAHVRVNPAHIDGYHVCMQYRARRRAQTARHPESSADQSVPSDLRSGLGLDDDLDIPDSGAADLVRD